MDIQYRTGRLEDIHDMTKPASPAARTIDRQVFGAVKETLNKAELAVSRFAGGHRARWARKNRGRVAARSDARGRGRGRFLARGLTPWPGGRRAPRWPDRRACGVGARFWPARDTASSGARRDSSRCGRDVRRTRAPPPSRAPPL